MIVRDFYNKIDAFAPFKAAYQWDNVGLLVGDMNAEVQRVLLTLDVTDAVVEYAIAQQINLIIAHHPLILFKPLKSVCEPKILRLIENKIAVIAAHTNLDISSPGVNTALANRLGLVDVAPLSMSADITQFLIQVYTPTDATEKVMQAMHIAGAGRIGNYNHCASYFDTYGQYKPIDNATPFIGEVGALETVKEQKIEMMCEDLFLSSVLREMTKAHPYETPAYSVIPLRQKSPNFGIGCKGFLVSEMSLGDFAGYVRERLGAPFVKLWLAGAGDGSMVKRVAVCGGAGNSAIYDAQACADVYVSSDFTYHQFLDAPLPVIDAGHFYTENVVMEVLEKVFVDCGVEVLNVGVDVHDVRKLKVVSGKW